MHGPPDQKKAPRTVDAAGGQIDEKAVRPLGSNAASMGWRVLAVKGTSLAKWPLNLGLIWLRSKRGGAQ